MMENNNFTRYRMYVLVEKHLSPINKGIQAAHAIAEYGMMIGMDEEYNDWVLRDKTIIILDGGTPKDLNNIRIEMDKRGIKCSEFQEEDLEYITTAIAFLVEDKVYEAEPFNVFQSNMVRENKGLLYEKGVDGIESYAEKEYCRLLGGENNVYINNIIKSKRLAQ